MLIEICRFDSFDEFDRFDENSAVLIVLMNFGSFDERYSVMKIFDSHQAELAKYTSCIGVAYY